MHSLMLTLEQESLSLRNLIQERVRQEVSKFNLTRPVCFKCLVQPAGAEDTAQGYRLPQHSDQDAEVHARKAIEAFEDRRFFVLVDGRDITDLDTVLQLGDESSIVFQKLMSVVAG